MNSEHRKFREDLIISPQESSGKTYYVIKDPVTNKYFRLNNAEYYITSNLDGNTSLLDLKDRIEREHNKLIPSINWISLSINWMNFV